jgi:hypothetical protein
MRPQAAKLLALAMPNWLEGGDGGIQEWWINILVGFEEALQEDGINTHFIRTDLVLNIPRARPNRRPDLGKFTDIQMERLRIIHHPHASEPSGGRMLSAVVLLYELNLKGYARRVSRRVGECAESSA